MYNIDKIKDDVRKSLSKFRYEHSIMVANEAKKLATKYNYDENKAYIATSIFLSLGSLVVIC